MMGAEPRLEPRAPGAVPEHAELLFRQAFGMGLATSSDLLALSRCREPKSVGQALGHRRVTTCSTENEDDRRQHPLLAQSVDHLSAPGRDEARMAQPTCTLGHARDALVQRHRSRMGAPVLEQGNEVHVPRSPLGDRNVVAQLDRTALLHHHFGGAPDLGQPSSKLFSVRHRRRQTDHHHLGRGDDYHFFPHRSPVRVLQVVHLVEDDQPEPAQHGCSGEKHVAQYFGGHHHHWSVRPVGDVPCEQTRALTPVHRGQLGELLVRQCLERRRVEGLATVGHGACDRVIGDHRLPRSSRGRHEHRTPRVERVAGLRLERVQPEGQTEFERVAHLRSARRFSAHEDNRLFTHVCQRRRSLPMMMETS